MELEKKCFNLFPKGCKNSFVRPSLPADLSFFIVFKDFKGSDSVISNFITCSSWSFGSGKSSKKETTFCIKRDYR